MVYCTNMRNLQLTESEETALVNAMLFIHDLGLPPHLEEDEAFETLWDKISDPAPFDYSWAHSKMKWSLKTSLRKCFQIWRQVKSTLRNPFVIWKQWQQTLQPNDLKTFLNKVFFIENPGGLKSVDKLAQDRLIFAPFYAMIIVWKI